MYVKTTIWFNKEAIHAIGKWVKSCIHTCCFISILLININTNINQHLCNCICQSFEYIDIGYEYKSLVERKEERKQKGKHSIKIN